MGKAKIAGVGLKLGLSVLVTVLLVAAIGFTVLDVFYATGGEIRRW